MSLLLNEDGSVKTYVVVDPHARTVLAAFNTVQRADKGLRELEKAGAENLSLHNMTHPKCPDWVMDFVRSDPDYCSRMAADNDKRAAALRRKAADLVSQAEGNERRAANWRELSEAASVPSVPGM